MNGCEFCGKRKNLFTGQRALMQIVQSGFSMDRLATDTRGELPMTDTGNRYILVGSDYFSRWTECFAMPNMEV